MPIDELQALLWITVASHAEQSCSLHNFSNICQKISKAACS